MKLRRNKKGFTIVELVIVIAVIGVLAAILIPTFINLTNKANKAADESLVKNLNTALAMQEQEVGDTKNNTLHDAVEDLKEYGYLLPNLVTKSEDKLLWNQETNRFILDKDITDSDTKVNFWRIQDSIKGDEEYSIYAGRDFEGNGQTVDIVNVKVGFDVGYHDEITTVNYANTVAGQKVRIRTAGGTLNIGTSATVAKGTIHQYGPIDKAEVYTENNSFHSHGVVQYLDLKAGKAVADEDGIIYVMKASSGTTVAEENGGVIIIPSNATSADIQTNDLPEGYEVTATGTTQPEDIAGKIAKNQGLLGSGTAADPFQVYNYETMQKVTLLYEAGYNYFRVNKSLTNNGTIDCTGWVPVYLNGSFDGNGVQFTNVTATLFQAVGHVNDSKEITLQNFTATMNVSAVGQYAAGSLVKNLGNVGITNFEKITIHGYIEGYWNVGSFFNYGPTNLYDNNSYYGFTANFVDCLSDASLVCASGNTCGGMIGHPYNASAPTTIRLENSYFEGKIYTTNGKGNKYVAITPSGGAHITLIEDGETLTDSQINNANYSGTYTIAKVNPTKDADGYNVVRANAAERIVITLTAQLTAFDDNNQKIPALSGITMVVGNSQIDNATEASYKALNQINSFELVLGASSYGYSVDGSGKLTVSIPSDDNYQTGTIRLQVNQYDVNGMIVSAGSLDIVSRTDLDGAWTIK